MSESVKELPKGWFEAKLKDLGFTKAQSINPADKADQMFELWSVPSYPIEKPEYQFGKDIGSNKIKVEPGDVLLCKINPRINRVWKVGEKKDNTQIASTEWIVFRPERIDPDFLRYRLMEPSVRKEICANVSGVGGSLTRARPQLIKELKITIAPLKEQKRIVDKIEALQAKSKKAKQALESAKPLLDKLRQSILASAFCGDLTSDWRKNNPDVEPASVLLERIRKERRKKWEENELAKMRAKGKEAKDDKWKSKYKEPEPANHSELYKLPSGWIWSKMEDVSQIASNLVDPLLHLSYPHIAPDNIEKYTGRLFEYNTIQEDGVKSAKNKFFTGQIVYSKIRPYLSKCIIAKFDGLCSADMYPIDPYIDTKYLYYYILSNTFLYHILKEAGNRVVLPKANQKQVYSVPVPIPPMSEQKQISKKIEDILKKKEFVEKFVSQSTEKIQKIDQSILKQAFCGDLVAQDPLDEPASHLLNHIKGTKISISKKCSKS